MKLSIIIPVFHEEKTIVSVLEAVEKYVSTQHEVLIVYDAKSDPTYPVASLFKKKHAQFPIHLVENAVGNKEGVMNAIKTGFLRAKGEAVVVVMADLADDISQIDKMFRLIEKGNDIVCASRYMKMGKKIGGTFLKSLLSKIAGWTLHVIFKYPTHDATNAFKMYRKTIFKHIHIESSGGFEYSLEIIGKAFKQGYKITEIPTVWRDREAGKSHFRLVDWLPEYVKWYKYCIYNPIADTWYWNILDRIWPIAIYVCIICVSLFLGVLVIGLHIVSKIPIISTLDFSWQTDSVERFLHGFISGRDFVFTYGPLFQLIYLLPANLFHLSSINSIVIAPLFVVFFIGIVLILSIQLLTENIQERIGLLAFLLFIIGIGFVTTSSEMFRMLLPIFFGLLYYKFLFENTRKLLGVCVITLPTFFGLYTYDIFLQCFSIIAGVSIIQLVLQKTIGLRAPYKKIFVAILGTILIQVLFSIVLTGSLLYVKAELTTVSDYFYIMNTTWEFGKSNYLLIFPLLMIVMYIYFLILQYPSRLKGKLAVIVGIALISLRAALIRSDGGHITSAIYPSIIVVGILIFYLLQRKNVVGWILLIFVFILLPFKSSYYDSLSIKNLKAVMQFVKTNPPFFQVFTLPKNSYSTEDLEAFKTIIVSHPGNVFMYPYDSFLLNIYHTTYNAYPLQFYDYSQSFVEKKAVENLAKNPPRFIIIGIDDVSVVALDGIKNFTKNPLFFLWLQDNYIVYQKTSRFVIYQYTKQTAREHNCSVQTITLGRDAVTFLDKIISFIKPVSWHVKADGYVTKLPYKPSISRYYLFNVKGKDFQNTKQYFFSKKEYKIDEKKYSIDCLSNSF